MDPEKLREAWQSQSCWTLGTDPHLLLKAARLERRALFWVDMFVISCCIGAGGLMLRTAFRDTQKDWPWLIYVASAAWVVGYMLFNRWRLRRDAAHYDDTLLAHVEKEIKELKHQSWLSRNTLWWYILPIALGCMISPVIFFAVDYSKNPELERLFSFLFTLGLLAASFIVIWLVMISVRPIGLEQRRKKLLALQALRESLLDTEE